MKHLLAERIDRVAPEALVLILQPVVNIDLLLRLIGLVDEVLHAP